ncbi:MAG: HEPN domain-containing protein [Candidatus Thermoplasmatota archaeon]
MRNDTMARPYIRDAEKELAQAEVAMQTEDYHIVYRRCQMSIELALKALLRAFGIEYPKEHDVSDALKNIKEKVPSWFAGKIKFISSVSSESAKKRGISIYGDERRGIPANELIKKEDAFNILNNAKEILNDCIKLLREINIIQEGKKMKANQAERKYIEVIKKMSGDKKVRICAELYEVAYRVVESSIKNDEPNISRKKLKEKTIERMS